MVDGYIINMWLMLVYSNYLNLTTFRTNKTMKGYWYGKLIAFIPWMISAALVIINY